MNNGALDRRRFEAIEAYVMGSMSPSQRQAFEQQMAVDAELRAEVELQRENTWAVELGGLSRLLKRTGEQQNGEHRARSGSWRRYLAYAAAASVLAIGAWWALRPSADERLFAEYHEADPGLPVPMSATAHPAFYDAMVSYKEGHYDAAQAKWSALLPAAPTSDTLRFYIGCAQLEEGNAKGSIPFFQGVAQDASSGFHDRARWFLFLAYLRTGNRAALKTMSLEDDPDHAELARTIKARLDL